MPSRPPTYPIWVDSGPNVIQPPSGLQTTGYTPGAVPDAQHFNWLFGQYNDWIQYLDSITSYGLLTTDLSTQSPTVATGTTLFYPDLIIGSTNTYTINGNMVGVNSITVEGYLVVNGTVRVL